MMLHILYLAMTVSVGFQQESFEQQDQHEKQYEYESRYYAKPEDKRSSVGKFMLLKVKGEIHNDDNMLDPLFTQISSPGGHKSIPDSAVPFPISLPFFFSPPHPLIPPFPFSHIQRIFSHPLGPADLPLFDHPHVPFESDANRAGQMMAVSKLLNGLSGPVQRPDLPPFGPGPMDGYHSGPFFHEDTPWGTPHYINMDQNGNMGNLDQPVFPGGPQSDFISHPDSSGRFFIHMPFMENGQSHGNDFPGHKNMYNENEGPMFNDGPQMTDPNYTPQWLSYFKQNTIGNGKSKPKQKQIKPNSSSSSNFNQMQELDQFGCHCGRPFVYDWNRMKRCMQQCAQATPYRIRMRK